MAHMGIVYSLSEFQFETYLYNDAVNKKIYEVFSPQEVTVATHKNFTDTDKIRSI